MFFALAVAPPEACLSAVRGRLGGIPGDAGVRAERRGALDGDDPRKEAESAEDEAARTGDKDRSVTRICSRRAASCAEKEVNQ